MSIRDAPLDPPSSRPAASSTAALPRPPQTERPPRPPKPRAMRPRAASSPPPSRSASPSPPSTPPSDASDDQHSVSRPSLFVHEPVARAAPLERYYAHAPRPLEILDELKSDQMEGIYNLSFLLLAFALLYLFTRNILEAGFLAGPSAICLPALLRDLRLLARFALPLPFVFVLPFALVRAHAENVLSQRAAAAAHAVLLAMFFAFSTAAIFRSKLNPLLSVLSGLLVVVVALKMHSYVTTNLLLAEETAARRRERRTRPPNHNNHNHNHNHNNDNADNVLTHENHSAMTMAATTMTTTTTATASVSSTDRGTASHANGNARPRHEVVYPRNVTVGNLLYFLVAPTLVYETGYPRTCAIRPAYVLSYALQASVCFLLQYVLLMQFCVPVWQSAAPSDQLWWFSIKLSLPSFFIWLLMFWGFFHCALNVVAELTCFADRQFYREWWNATTLHQFWRTWNMPVHEWCLRHLYVESVSRHHVNARAAALGTFLLSAVLHEYVCLVGFRMLRPYMFTGMVGQVPLMEYSTRWAGTRRGNLIMWAMLFFGQSWIMLLYVRDYLTANGTLMCVPQ